MHLIQAAMTVGKVERMEASVGQGETPGRKKFKFQKIERVHMMIPLLLITK